MMARKPAEQGRLTAASAPLRLGDTEYQMSRLTDLDISELDEWVQARFVENARASLKGETDEVVRKETLSIAMETSLGVTWLSGVGASMMATPLGMTRLVWQCIKKKHPDTTMTELSKDMFDPENIERARATFAKLNLGKEQGPTLKHKGRGKKNRARRRKFTGR